jgi:hypothetical protein
LAGNPPKAHGASCQPLSTDTKHVCILLQIFKKGKEDMLKKVSKSGVLYILIAILFMAGAIGKTITEDPVVIAMQWGCAVIFASVGISLLIKFVKPETASK